MTRINFSSKYLFLLFFSLSISTFNGLSQIDNYELSGAKPGVLDTLAMQTSQKIVSESTGILEKEIDPEKYIVGPGDVITLAILTTKTKEYDLMISPDGSILLPDAGTVMLKGKSFAQSEKLIKEKIKKVFKTDEVYLILKDLRKFKVIISGSVKKTAIVTASAVDRVSEIIEKAGGLKPDGSVRKIQLYRAGSSKPIIVDLIKFFRTQDENANPTVLGGDHIVIPPISKNQTITISGDVPFPGSFEYNSDDSLADLVRFANGFYPTSFLDSVEYVQKFEESDEFRIKYLNLKSWRVISEIDEYPELNLPLKSGDRIYIKKDPFYKDAQEVVIVGEVKFPGKYAVDGRTTRVSNILQKAGGITDKAALDASMLIRQSEIGVPDKEMERLRRTPTNEMSENEYRYFQSKASEQQGVMAINFNTLMNNPNSVDNIVLLNKDSIVITEKKYFINVQGRVNNPGLVVFNSKENYLDYINSAGGFGFRADASSTLIVKSKGQQFLAESRNYQLEPGDNILVPPKTETKLGEILLTSLTVTVQLLTIAGVIIAVLKTK
jgi:protein involved in polysaccharide export with SLBB domain